MPEEIKDLDKLKPIDHAVVAKPHMPVYKMHRYFARRPWSVFQELIEHYSNPGSIILDPFCGGGVLSMSWIGKETVMNYPQYCC